MNKLLTSKLSFISFAISIYIVIIVIVLALLLIPISKNFLIYSLTFSQNVSPDSKLFIGMEFFFYLLCVLSPFLFYGIFKRKKIIEFNSIIWNFIFILITSIFFLFNVNKLVNLFQFKTREYVYYELVYLDSEKLAKWGLKDLYLLDTNPSFVHSGHLDLHFCVGLFWTPCCFGLLNFFVDEVISGDSLPAVRESTCLTFTLSGGSIFIRLKARFFETVVKEPYIKSSSSACEFLVSSVLS
jgi:hypothetical protein